MDLTTKQEKKETMAVAKERSVALHDLHNSDRYKSHP